MGIIIALIVGGITGWVASLIMKTDNQMGMLINIVVGIVGALLGSWLFGTVLGFGSAWSAGSFSLIGFFWSILGAVVLIGILKLFKILK
jgi:uncharacterized membrane protein YeaQ/YmgE (transglycosylase-associated protein family)